jgi:hypothetical protein
MKKIILACKLKIFYIIGGSGRHGITLSGDDANRSSPWWKPGSCSWGSPPPFIITKKTEKPS